jgi:hypothetical protein
MSLPKKNQSQLGASIVGACLAVISSIPLTAYLGALFGETYNMRVAIYGGLLLWVVVGAISIFCITSKSANQSISPNRIALWFISTWLWPIPLLMWKRKRQ